MKKFLLPVFSLLLAVALSAFSKPATIKHTDPLWYYTGADGTQHGNPSFYEPLVDQEVEAECPGESNVRCVIEAPEDGMTGKPDLSNITSFVSFKP